MSAHLLHPVEMDADDVPPPASDFSSYRRVRQERASDALICLYSKVLGQPLARRELSDEEWDRRDARLQSRGRPPAS